MNVYTCCAAIIVEAAMSTLNSGTVRVTGARMMRFERCVETEHGDVQTSQVQSSALDTGLGYRRIDSRSIDTLAALFNPSSAYAIEYVIGPYSGSGLRKYVAPVSVGRL